MNKTFRQLQHEFYAKWDLMHEIGVSHEKAMSFSTKWGKVFRQIASYFGIERRNGGYKLTKQQWDEVLPESFWDCI